MMQNFNHSPGTITLIGSGKMLPSIGKVHRAVMSRISGSVRAAFLDAPAGFELSAFIPTFAVRENTSPR